MGRIVRAFGLVLALALAPGARNAYAEERPPVHAEQGSVAIGGNVSNSTIGVPYEKVEELVRLRTKPLEDLSESQRDTIALLKEKLDLNQRQVQSALEILGEANVPPEKLAAKLAEIAGKYKELQTAAAAQPGDDAKITALKAEAQKAVQDGQLGKADEILAEIEKIQTEALDRLALNAAQTTAQRGDLALTRLRYPEAAQHFAEAAAKVPAGHEEERWKYLNEEAGALFRQGDEFGDNEAARSAIERDRHLAELRPRNAFPRDWAMIQNYLGNALKVLGERESGTARLEEAVVAFREALQENSRERVPLQWAMTQMNLGNALERIGEREGGTARLNEAVAAFREALKEDTRERVPLLWAATQVNLGLALVTLGGRESGTGRLDEAVAAFRDALQEFTRARVPLQWATTQVSLGLALVTLGGRESGTARLDEAVGAYREALQEFTRERVPPQWAVTQVSLGLALEKLGERESGTARLEEALSAYRDALQENTRARVPLDWARTQMNLGNALETLGERESGTARLEEAVAAYREALQEFTREQVPLQWAKSTGNQAVAMVVLAERRRDAKMAKLAVQQIEAALTILRDGGDAPSAAFCERQLAKARALTQKLAKR
ncbi:MAG: tetratricopeptide repeat protein [Methylocella sp.]